MHELSHAIIDERSDGLFDVEIRGKISGLNSHAACEHIARRVEKAMTEGLGFLSGAYGHDDGGVGI
jgi:hypothetical protein